MKRVLKWIGIVLGAIIGLLILFVLGLYIKGSMLINQVNTFPADNISIPTDPASLARGKHLVDMDCRGCHTPDLGGMVGWLSSPQLGTIDSMNLTSGQGGIGKTFTDQDYVRAIRHAINPQGKGTFMVSVSAFQHLSDSDLGDIVAYIKTVPPVDRVHADRQLKPMAFILIGAGAFPWPVAIASHAENISAPAAGVTTDYGKYLVDAVGCRDCHAQNLAGGPYPQPGITKIVPDITPGGEIKSWSEAQFMQAIRTGTTPSGHQLDPALMPWKDFSSATDDELKAIFMYLQSVPALPQNPAK